MYGKSQHRLLPLEKSKGKDTWPEAIVHQPLCRRVKQARLKVLRITSTHIDLLSAKPQTILICEEGKEIWSRSKMITALERANHFVPQKLEALGDL